MKYCNIVMTGTDIVTVSGHDKKSFYGYSIFTEEFIQVPINKCLHVDESAFYIVRNKKAQMRLAMAIADKKEDAANLIGVNRRTFYRWKTQFKL